MEMATMSCKRSTKEEIRVLVEIPRTPCERCLEVTNHKLCIKLYIAFVFLTAMAIMGSVWWIPFLMGYCQETPSLNLKDVNVHAMNVYQNTTLPGTPYQANNDISVQLKAMNFNTVKGCFTTFRRVAVSVDFKGQRLLHQVVPLEGFGLKPGETRIMTLELKGENAPLNNEIGSLLAFEVRNTSAVELTLSFAARWMRNDRKASWLSMNCDVTTKALPTSGGGLEYKVCI